MSDKLSDFDGRKTLLSVVKNKIITRYDPANEAEVRSWILALTDTTIEAGADNFFISLRDGVVLVKLVKAVYDRTPALPESAQNYKRLIKFSLTDINFKMMENIEIYLKACEAYGVTSTGIFPTVDLFEGRNLGNVIHCILQLGSEAQRNNCDAPPCGPKPMTKNFRNWSDEQLRAGHGLIGCQAGSNKFASQKGMSIGSVRHVSDIRADDFKQEGQGVINLQSGTNKFASQKGMSMGSVRHGNDVKSVEISQNSHAYIGLQAGTNKFASQKGMSMGSVRHIGDIKGGDACPESNGVISLQAGTNQFASQKGMSIGSIRHIADVKTDDMSMDSKGIINYQAGSNRFASQKGMQIGGVRHVADIKTDEPVKDSYGIIRLQSGTNQFANQQGLSFGKPRGINDIRVVDQAALHDDMKIYYDYQYQVPHQQRTEYHYVQQDDDDGWL